MLAWREVEFPSEGGLRLAAARREGDGPLLLFVHGNSSDRGVWRHLVDAMPRRAALILDLRGHGASDWARPPAYATADYAADIAGVVRALAGMDFILVGHSNGALCCLFHAVHGSPPPRAVVHLDIEPAVPAHQIAYFRQRAGAAARVFPALADIVRGMRAVDPTVPDAIFQPFISGLVRAAEGGFRLGFDPETYASWQPADLWPALPRLLCPLLVVRAAESVVMSAAAAERMVASAPRATLETIPDAGHFMMLGKPNETAAAIERFLATNGI